MIIAKLALCASLAIYHLVSNARSWNNNKLLNITHRKGFIFAVSGSCLEYDLSFTSRLKKDIHLQLILWHLLSLKLVTGWNLGVCNFTKCLVSWILIIMVMNWCRFSNQVERSYLELYAFMCTTVTPGQITIIIIYDQRYGDRASFWSVSCIKWQSVHLYTQLSSLDHNIGKCCIRCI